MPTPIYPTPVDYFDPLYMETLYKALFALLQSVTFPAPFNPVTVSRATKAPDEVPPALQPAIFQIQGPMKATQEKVFGPSKTEFTAAWVLYLRGDGAETLDSTTPTLMNLAVWALNNAFNTLPPYQKQTLGGNVHHAWIDGPIYMETVGDGNQFIVALPIHILPA